MASISDLWDQHHGGESGEAQFGPNHSLSLFEGWLPSTRSQSTVIGFLVRQVTATTTLHSLLSSAVVGASEARRRQEVLHDLGYHGGRIHISRCYRSHFQLPFFPPVLPSSLLQALPSSFLLLSFFFPIRIPFPNHGKFNLRVSTTRRSLCLAAQSAEQQGQVQEDEVVDSKILPYCSLDRKAEKTLGELEQEFLQALQSFYYDKEPMMSNEEFDNLKEELMWEGSSVVMLSADEQKLLEASMAYVAGKPIMSDEEFDALKLRLKKDGSKAMQEGPRCSLRSRKVYSDLEVDYFKMFLLNVPAAIVSLTLFFFLDDLTGFEITYLLELPEPFSFIFTWFAALPLIFWVAQGITNAILKNFLILKGPCPNCATENVSFFGTILTIPSGGSTNTIKCTSCRTGLIYDAGSRLITLASEPEGAKA